MSDTVIVQHCYSGSDYGRLLELTVPIHVAYCRKHNVDFHIVYGDPEENDVTTSGHSFQTILIQRLLHTQYKYIAYLDADAVILDFSTDLRTAFTSGIGLVKYKIDSTQSLFCTGVVYFTNTEAVKSFVDEWVIEPVFPRWYELGSFHVIMDRHPDIVIEIEKRWNMNFQDRCSNPVVFAMHHGFLTVDQRIEGIKKELGMA